jgi:DNA modification methylase
MNTVIPYETFLTSKHFVAPPAGFDVDPAQINPMLFPFQRDITLWALRRGRSAVFADCGMGKTAIELEWRKFVSAYTGKPVLILAPLAVSKQTVREGEKFGVAVNICRSSGDLVPGVNITNYEMLGHFDPDLLGGVCADESSILKARDGVTCQALTEFARGIPFRLAASATPAPNDLVELTNHAEFLDVMHGKEIIALFFTQDGNTTHRFRLKGHAKRDYWRWLASWSVALRRPSDLGYPDGDFILPPLEMHQLVVASGPSTTTLFPVEALTMQERRAARRDSLTERVKVCADMVNASDQPWLIWCDLNVESEQLARSIPDAVEVRGTDTPEHKEDSMLDFAAGKIRVLVTKPSIAGFGMNWQHCANVAFVGLSDSYEQFYQAVRRVWRFGQKKQVNCYVITSEMEGAVLKNIKRKEKQAAEMMENLVDNMAGLSLGQAERSKMEYRRETATGKGWTMHLGDSVEVVGEMEPNSIGLSIFSPPFPGMYAYTDSEHDMGNVRDIEEMLQHYSYLIAPLLRVTMPGRLCCVHLTQSPAFKNREGYIGLHDFRGRMIEMMQAGGWVYTGEVTIDKNPQVKAARTKEMGLLFKTLATDSSMSRMALADYLIYFKKPGDNPRPINSGSNPKYNDGPGWITDEEWIEWAAPVWYGADRGVPGGIRETDVLNVTQARETNDERHLCPLQLGVIKRAIKLWSAPGDTVLDPFGGIGSTGFEALKLDRLFVGVELKQSYWRSAIRNLENAVRLGSQVSFFHMLGPDETPEPENSTGTEDPFNPDQSIDPDQSLDAA